MENDQLQDHKHDFNDPGHDHSYIDYSTLNNDESNGPEDGRGNFNYYSNRRTDNEKTGVNYNYTFITLISQLSVSTLCPLPTEVAMRPGLRT